MIKNQKLHADKTHKKSKAISKMTLVLEKLQKQWNFPKISEAYGKIYSTKKKCVYKFTVLEVIINKKIRHAFLKILSYHSKMPSSKRISYSSSKLGILVVNKFVLKS